MRHFRFSIGIGLLLVLALALPASAGCIVNNDLSGQVLDYRDSLPIAGAVVCLYSQCSECGSISGELFALTDAEGRFTIADCCTLYFSVGPAFGHVAYYAVAAGYDTSSVDYFWDQLGCPDEDDYASGPHYHMFYLQPQPVGVDEPRDLTPPEVDLSLAAFPSPFNATTTITFSLPASADIDISLIDVRGRVVRHLTRGFLPSGTHLFTWDGRDDSGRTAASGIYFCRLVADSRSVTRKLVLLK